MGVWHSAGGRTMKTLREAPFEPRFFERSALFAPVIRGARALASASLPGAGDEPRGFPPVERYGEVFDAGGAPVRFERADPRPRRRRRKEPVDARTLYDARITLERVVPTRAGSWHDFMNALVWGAFPQAKTALHARQHRAITERIVPGARTLPSTRTRELDALALLDEGGVLLAGAHAEPVVFGHAIYESLALGVPPAVVAAIRLDPDLGAVAAGAARGERAALAELDRALAAAIGDPAQLRTPEALSRVELPLATAPPAKASIQGGAWATCPAPADESLRSLATRAVPLAPR